MTFKPSQSKHSITSRCFPFAASYCRQRLRLVQLRFSPAGTCMATVDALGMPFGSFSFACGVATPETAPAEGSCTPHPMVHSFPGDDLRLGSRLLAALFDTLLRDRKMPTAHCCARYLFDHLTRTGNAATLSPSPLLQQHNLSLGRSRCGLHICPLRYRKLRARTSLDRSQRIDAGAAHGNGQKSTES